VDYAATLLKTVGRKRKTSIRDLKVGKERQKSKDLPLHQQLKTRKLNMGGLPKMICKSKTQLFGLQIQEQLSIPHPIETCW